MILWGLNNRKRVLKSMIQGCHWSGKSRGILEFVREIQKFVESQGN